MLLIVVFLPALPVKYSQSMLVLRELIAVLNLLPIGQQQITGVVVIDIAVLLAGLRGCLRIMTVCDGDRANGAFV